MDTVTAFTDVNVAIPQCKDTQLQVQVLAKCSVIYSVLYFCIIITEALISISKPHFTVLAGRDGANLNHFTYYWPHL